MRIAILGFGLIGGSIARAVAALSGDQPRPSIAAWAPSGQGPARARADGVVEAAARTPAEAIDGADLVLLAAPPLACLGLLGELAGALAPALRADAVVTDVASTKARIVERAAALRLRFVGGHPMAGRETTGYGSADAALFVDRPWVVVPSGDGEAEHSVEALAIACGARPVRLGAREHDAAVAAISHLPLVLAAALVEAVGSAPDWPIARSLAAGGWADMTRLARGDVAMGTGIAATNAAALAARLRDVRDVLDGWLADLAGHEEPDVDAVAGRLRAARARLEDPAS